MNLAVQRIIDAVSSIVLGKEQQIRLALVCLLARGHLLIEDLPGMGKTTLAHALASALGLGFQRIQFTSDLLPADILGTSVFEAKESRFTFHPGPIFSQVILADEVNRATPKTQSALLEAMEEQQVTIDGVSHALATPFFVIATQNPSHQIGTYPLPESQLDRFLMKVEIGYPNAQFERRLFAGESGREQIKQLTPQIQLDELIDLQRQVQEVNTSETFISYAMKLVQHSRQSDVFDHGLSPRGGMSLVAAAKGWAFVHGRDYAVPEDLQAVFQAVSGHRLQHSEVGSGSGGESVSSILNQVKVPV